MESKNIRWGPLRGYGKRVCVMTRKATVTLIDKLPRHGGGGVVGFCWGGGVGGGCGEP